MSSQTHLCVHDGSYLWGEKKKNEWHAVGSEEVEQFGELGEEQASSVGGQKGVDDMLVQAVWCVCERGCHQLTYLHVAGIY